MKNYSAKEHIRVLNQIITYGNILPVIPYGNKFIEFILEAFNSINNVESVLICLRDQKKPLGNLIDNRCNKCKFFENSENYSCLLSEKTNLNVISIGTFQNNYGSIAFKTNSSFPKDLLSALHNFANNVTVYIENHHQKEKLIEINKELLSHRDNLEELVQQKTFILKNQNLEYSLLNEEYKSQTEKLIKAQELGKIGHWELNIESGKIIWSDQSYNIFNLSPNDFEPTYDNFLKMVHPDDKSLVDKTFTNSIKNQGPYAVDHRIKLPDGTIRYLSERGETIYNDKGSPLTSVGTVQDITDRKNAELQLEKERKRTLRAQFEGEEIEKNRISSELHDGLGQILTAAKLSLAALENNKGLSNEIKKKVQDIKVIVNEANVETSRISKHLLPRVLEDYGLIIAVEKMLSDIKNTLYIDTKLTVSPKIKLCGEKDRIIYRIIQESINNVIKHSSATFLEVTFDSKDNYHIITVSDNGKGFYIDLKKDSGLGLENLKQRAISIDADLEISSEIKKGTRIVLKYKISE
ncbi:MAG: PAS domain-containing protein [Cyclobacteriaceae bacterium]|nr:PAS domain-containing protein [Cyclobacteriaceae bacterium]